jgi:hypothetical protein
MNPDFRPQKGANSTKTENLPGLLTAPSSFQRLAFVPPPAFDFRDAGECHFSRTDLFTVGDGQFFFLPLAALQREEARQEQVRVIPHSEAPTR